jgi:transposase
MKRNLFVRALSAEEQEALAKSLKSKQAYTRRRAQALRFSSHGLSPQQIAEGLGLSGQGVRKIIHDFHGRGLDSLMPPKMGPKQPVRLLDAEARSRLMEIAHQSPRSFSKPRSRWSLQLLAEVAFEEGLTPHQVSYETIRQAIAILGCSWQRAKHWIESPDEQYQLKKSNVIA